MKRQNAEKVMRVAQKVIISCEKCGSRNYAMPVKQGATKRLELKKFCAHCNEHTMHKQTI
ncbi:50S ribosomal protein L33 [Lysinibacillus louembei]